MPRSGSDRQPLPFPRPSGAPPGGAPGDDRQVSRPARLAVPLTHFIGREGLIAALAGRIRAGARLLTLTGPGGVGKTRLALEVAGRLRADFADGVVFVDLAPLREAGLVLPTVAQALGVEEAPGTPLLETLAGHLRGWPCLLVLDNFEQVVAAGPEIAALLGVVPEVQMLVTSRTALRVYGEQEFPVPPLDLPVADPAALTASQLAEAEAVQLFVARARDVQPDFALTEANAAAVAAICRRLDGLPLALELAAARTRLFAPAALLARLDQRLPLLTGGGQDRPARQQTLRDAIAWSYDLLDAGERELFARLSVFVGGAPLDAIQAVLAPLRWAEADLLDGLDGLIAQNLLRRGERADGEPRFLMLGTLQEFAGEQLAAGGVLAATQREHARFFLDWAERGAAGAGPEEATWLDRLEAEHDNLRAVLAWSVAAGAEESAERGEWGVRLALAVTWLWRTRGYLREGAQWFTTLGPVLDRLVAAGPQPWHAAAYRAAGALISQRGDMAAAQRWTERSLDLARRLGDALQTARALNNMGGFACHWGDYRQAERFYQESLVLRRDLDDAAGVQVVLVNLALVDRIRGNYARALARCEEGIAGARALGDSYRLGLNLNYMAAVARRAGQPERALALLREGLTHAAGYPELQAHMWTDLGAVLCDQGADDAAAAYLEEALALHRAMEDHEGLVTTLTELGRVATHRGDYDQGRTLLQDVVRRCLQRQDYSAMTTEGFEALVALEAAAGKTVQQARRVARLLGAGEAQRERMGAPLPPSAQAGHTAVIATLQRVLGPAAFAAARTAGHALPFAEALALAVQEPDAAAAAPAEGAPAPGGLSAPGSRDLLDLTEREVEVLRLVAAGLTNKEIATQLDLSPRTVQAHLYRIFGKLDVTTRSGAARAAADRGLI